MSGYCRVWDLICLAYHNVFILSTITGSQPGNFDHTIVNDDLEIAYEKLKGILIQVRWSVQNNFF